MSDETTSLKPIRTLNTTKGGILQAVAGHKTISLGYDNPPTGLVYLQNDSDPSISIPVIVESVKAGVKFNDISEDEARAAGYSSKDRMASRLVRSAVLTTGRDGPDSNLKHAQTWLSEQSVWTLASFRLATPEELKAAGADPEQARSTVQQSVQNVLANPDETVERAQAKMGVGEQALRINLQRAIDAQYPSKQLGAA